MLLPEPQWHRLFDPLSASRPDLVATQIHVARAHHLPPDPAAAYTAVTGAARNLEARSAGAALVGDNLGAALDAARSDAAYAQVLFLFLGLPGAVLAALLTAAVTAAGSTRRRPSRPCCGPAAPPHANCSAWPGSKPPSSACTGAALGLADRRAGRLAHVRVATLRPHRRRPRGVAPPRPRVIGMLVATATVLLPARRDLREHTVAAGRAQIGPTRARRSGRGWGWTASSSRVAARWCSAATTCTGYHLVLAPEGVPAISVSYWAFAGPALLWLGAGAADLAARRPAPRPRPGLLARVLRPVTGRLGPTIAAGMSRGSVARWCGPSSCSLWRSPSPRRPRRSTPPTASRPKSMRS